MFGSGRNVCQMYFQNYFEAHTFIVLRFSEATFENLTTIFSFRFNLQNILPKQAFKISKMCVYMQHDICMHIKYSSNWESSVFQSIK